MIDSYSALQTSIADFLNRDDLTATIPTFISLAEANFQRDIDHWRREERATSDVDGQYASLPTNFHSPIRAILQGKYAPLEAMSLNEMASERALRNDAAGIPTNYALTGGEIELFPTPSDTFTLEMVYREKIPVLSDSNTSNWLLEQAPDVYLYGALVHSAPYLQDDSRTAVWGAMYSAALDAVNADGNRGKWGGRLRIR